MTDPASSDYDRDGGLNASDTSAQDQRDVARSMRRFLIFGTPIIAAVAIGAAFLVMNVARKMQATATPPAAVAMPAISDKDAQIAQLQSQILRLQGQAAVPNPAVAAIPGAVAAPVPTPVYADPALIAQLSARIDRLEANQRALARAAAAANAAAVLQSRAHTSEPFLNELAAVEPAFDNPALTAPLRAVADKGVPSETQLAVEFPQAAMKANIAAKAASDADTMFNRARHAMGSFISVRRTDKPNCKGTQGALQCAEARLNAGDLTGALTYLGTLPPAAQTAMKPWLDKAKARNLVDGHTQRITQLALQRLVQANDSAPVATAGGAL